MKFIGSIFSVSLAAMLITGLFAGVCARSPINIFMIPSDDRGIVIAIYAIAMGFSIFGCVVDLFVRFRIRGGEINRATSVPRKIGISIVIGVVSYFAINVILLKMFCS